MLNLDKALDRPLEIVARWSGPFCCPLDWDTFSRTIILVGYGRRMEFDASTLWERGCIVRKTLKEAIEQHYPG